MTEIERECIPADLLKPTCVVIDGTERMDMPDVMFLYERYNHIKKDSGSADFRILSMNHIKIVNVLINI